MDTPLPFPATEPVTESLSTTPSAPSAPPAGRRGRGAPPGNKNALKHGFYSRSFREIDLTDLEKNKFTGLQDEITMLRVYMRFLTEMAGNINNFSDALGLLRVLSMASISLSRLITTQKLAFPESGQLAGEVDEAIAELYANTPLFQSLQR